MIADDIALSRVMAEAVAAHPELELVTQALSITTFRYVPAVLRPHRDEPRVAEYLDTLNRELLGAIQRGGEAFVSNAVVRGRFLLRACIVNFHTTVEDVEAVPEIAGRLGAELDARMRAQALGDE
jgi:aromatic-L-amino-acid decarboxylase